MLEVFKMNGKNVITWFLSLPGPLPVCKLFRIFLKKELAMWHITWLINATFTRLLRTMNFFVCAKFWFSSILCAVVIASDSHSHFPNVIKPIRPKPIIYLIKKGKSNNKENWNEKKRKKRNGYILSFYIGYFKDSFWLTFSKLQLGIQSKSNFSHKVEPKLNIVRLLLLFRVYGWEVLIMLTREPANKDDRVFFIHLV